MTLIMYVARDRLFDSLYMHAGEPIRKHGVFTSARGEVELPKDCPEFAHLKHRDDPIKVTIEISLA